MKQKIPKQIYVMIANCGDTFTGAGGSHDRNELPLANRERHASQGMDGLVAYVEVSFYIV